MLEGRLGALLGEEEVFAEVGELGDGLDPETLPALAGRYGCSVGFDGTATVVERHGLTF